MSIDERLAKLAERHEALTADLARMHREIQGLIVASQHDGENIRALLRTAEIQERRAIQ